MADPSEAASALLCFLCIELLSPHFANAQAVLQLWYSVRRRAAESLIALG